MTESFDLEQENTCLKDRIMRVKERLEKYSTGEMQLALKVGEALTILNEAEG